MKSSRYPIPAGSFRNEIEVERSRFITTVQNVTSPDAAQKFIASVKAEFSDANHNCWAYLVGAPGNADQIGMSDDGEPHGTAGKPMLTALQYSGLGDTAVVVTRYFGGIKLGKGGMVKAYTAAVKTALELTPTMQKVNMVSMRVTLDYALLEPLQRRLGEFEAELGDADYGEHVCCHIRLPEENHDRFVSMVNDLTSGQGCIALLD